MALNATRSAEIPVYVVAWFSRLWHGLEQTAYKYMQHAYPLSNMLGRQRKGLVTPQDAEVDSYHNA